MSKENTPYFKGAFWLGLLILIPSAWLLYKALTADSASLNAPKWIGVAFALMFLNAAITVTLLDAAFNKFRESGWFAYSQAGAILSIPLLFALMLNWVAFGPGVREFSGGVGIPFLFFSFGNANSIVGRVVFAIPALLMDVFAVIIIWAVIANILGIEQE